MIMKGNVVSYDYMGYENLHVQIIPSLPWPKYRERAHPMIPGFEKSHASQVQSCYLVSCLDLILMGRIFSVAHHCYVTEITHERGVICFGGTLIGLNRLEVNVLGEDTFCQLVSHINGCCFMSFLDFNFFLSLLFIRCSMDWRPNWGRKRRKIE